MIERIGTNGAGGANVKAMLDEAREYHKDTQTKALTIFLCTEKDGERVYKVNWFNAGMSMSEIVALCEVMKINALREMEYVS